VVHWLVKVFAQFLKNAILLIPKGTLGFCTISFKLLFGLVVSVSLAALTYHFFTDRDD
jgi:hypothetical protein